MAGPGRVSGHVQETLAARGTSPSPARLQGDPGHPPYARLMTCANT